MPHKASENSRRSNETVAQGTSLDNNESSSRVIKNGVVLLQLSLGDLNRHHNINSTTQTTNTSTLNSVLETVSACSDYHDRDQTVVITKGTKFSASIRDESLDK